MLYKAKAFVYPWQRMCKKSKSIPKPSPTAENWILISTFNRKTLESNSRIHKTTNLRQWAIRFSKKLDSYQSIEHIASDNQNTKPPIRYNQSKTTMQEHRHISKSENHPKNHPNQNEELSRIAQTSKTHHNTNHKHKTQINPTTQIQNRPIKKSKEEPLP